MAGENFERQEIAICRAVEGARFMNESKPLMIVTGEANLANVTACTKYAGRQLGGSEAYTDIVFVIDDVVCYNVSCKGEYAPSLAGGGLKGIELAVPGLARTFINAAHSYLLNELKLEAGSEVPNVFGRISDENKLRIAVGNKHMGGPLDYMYIGPMDVQWTYDSIQASLKLNGNLIPTYTFATSRDFYFRLRARRHDQRFEPELRDKQGIPRIYGRSPSKGDVGNRLVVCDASHVSKDGIIIEYERMAESSEIRQEIEGSINGV